MLVRCYTDACCVFKNIIVIVVFFGNILQYVSELYFPEMRIVFYVFFPWEQTIKQTIETDSFVGYSIIISEICL